MSDQLRKHRMTESQTREVDEVEATPTNPDVQARKAELDANTEAMLDEIDELLGSEEQGQALVANFKQKGGQ